MQVPIPEHIASIVPYPPGKPLDELERQYGISKAIKLASNENPWGPSPKALAAITTALADLHRYPDGASYALTQALAQHLGCSPEMLVLGNGSNEVIEFLVKACLEPGDEVITSHPSFLMYQKFVQIRGGTNRVIPLADMHHDLAAIGAAVSERTRLIFLDNPNNPTGTVFDEQALVRLCRLLPTSVVLVLDEAYVDFVEPALRLDSIGHIQKQDKGPEIVALRTFSKAYGLAGLRLGFGIMSAPLAAMLHRVRQPFNINTLAQKAALAALDDHAHYTRTIDGTRRGMAFLQKELCRLGCTCHPSQANFFLVDVGGQAHPLYEAMLHKGVILRSMHAYGYPNCIRITVGTEEENQRLLAALGPCLRELGYA